jgi:acyl-CoA thioesterase
VDYQHIRDYFNARNPFAQDLGIVVAEVGEGFARCRLAVGERHLNPFGTANAGAVFSLAETAFGVAANAQGRVAVAVNLAISYLAPARGELIAEAREVAAGGPLASYAVVITDESGTTVAQAQAMAYRKKDALPGLAES